MMKKIREMGWEMHFLHLSFFVLGAIALIVLVVHHDNPKLGENPLLLLIPAIGLMGGGVFSFLICLFSKEEGKYHPYVSQEEKDRMTTSNTK